MVALRSVAIAGSALMLAYCTLNLITADGNVVYAAPGLSAWVLLASLAALGTSLGRVPQAPLAVLIAGIIGVLDVVVGMGGHHGPFALGLAVAYALAVLATLAAGILQVRRPKSAADSKPPQ